MKPYHRPELHDLGTMSHVTRKSGPFADGDPAFATQDFNDLPAIIVAICKSALGPFIPFCDPFYPP